MKNKKMLYSVSRENFEVENGMCGGYRCVTNEMTLKNLIIYLIKNYEKIEKESDNELKEFETYKVNKKTCLYEEED